LFNDDGKAEPGNERWSAFALSLTAMAYGAALLARDSYNTNNKSNIVEWFLHNVITKYKL